MKLHKLISRTVLATALLGTTFGLAFSSVSAASDSQSDDTIGDTTIPNMSQKVKSGGSNSFGNDKTPTNTKVKDGFLTLDSVPRLSFGSDQSNSSNSADQPATFKLNSQNNGVLRITDYRNIDDRQKTDTGSKPTGWTLQASMSKFTHNGSYSGSSLDQNNWTMHLKNNGNYHNLDAENGNDRASYANFNNQDLDTSGNNKNILDSSASTSGTGGSNIGKGYGVNEIDYNDSNDASLDIPNVPSGEYTANVNWNLTTSLNSYNTESDNAPS